jgi:hypothetical protein
LGVLGGGQLGRMFVHAAQALGYRCIVLDPDAISPAGSVAEKHVQADYLDSFGLAQMARDCDAITTEFENVPAVALETLAGMRIVAPAAAAALPFSPFPPRLSPSARTAPSRRPISRPPACPARRMPSSRTRSSWPPSTRPCCPAS